MKKFNRSQSIVVVAIALMLAVISCTPAGDNKIVGKWAQGTNTSVTFTKEGLMTTTEDGKTTTGKYYVTNGNILAITMDVLPLTIQFKMEFPSDKDLTLSMQATKETPDVGNKQAEHFTRVSN